MMTSILVLLYNKEINESETLNHIKKCSLNFSTVHLTIWNNGPSELREHNVSEFTKMGFKVSIVNTLENRSLGFIYNNFITRNPDSSKFIFLDHDSYITEQYLKDALSYDDAILLPKVTSYGELCSPNKLPKKEKYSNSDHIVAIGSGIVINSETIHILNSHYQSVFDDSFFLYGVDTSFMLRLRRLKLYKKIKLIRGFEHSLSKNEIESDEVKQFRRNEMAISTAIIARKYPSYSAYRRLFKYLYRSYRGVTNYPSREMLKAFFKGKHQKGEF